jgi:hypothetical protein
MCDTGNEGEDNFRSQDDNIGRAWALSQRFRFVLGYCVTSNQFAADIGPNGEKALFKMFAKAATWQVEYAILQGAGAGGQMPLGILNSPAYKKVTRSGPTTIAAADIAGMAGAMIPSGWKHGIWAAHPTTLPKIVAITQYFINKSGDSLEEGDMAGRLLTRRLSSSRTGKYGVCDRFVH